MKTHHVTTAFFAALALGTSSALATTYYWVPDANTWGEFADPANWLIDNAEGAAAETYPGTDDTLAPKRTMRLDLGGATHEVGYWNNLADWNRWNLYVTNGTLRITKQSQIHQGTIDIMDGGALVFGPSAQFVPALYDGGMRTIDVHAGGSFVTEGGELNMYKMGLTIDADATASLTSSKFVCGYGTYQTSFIVNRGRLALPGGLFLASDSSSHGTLNLAQEAGELTLGGSLGTESETVYNVTFSGGTVKVTEDVGITASSAVIPSTANLTIDVAEDKVFSLSPFTIESGALITKTGSGYLGLGTDVPTGLTLQEGGVALMQMGDYDLTSLTASASGATIRFDAVVTLTGTVDANVTFTVDFAKMSKDVVFVTCADAELRARIRTDLAAQAPAGTEVVENGDGLMLVAEIGYKFNTTTVTDLNDPTGWSGGVVPPEGAEVYVTGYGVVGVLTADTPAFGAISVSQGAELKVALGAEESVELPQIILSGRGGIVIESGTAVMSGGLSSVATEDEIPSFTVAEGAKVSLTSAVALKNIDLTMNGTLEQTDAGHLNLGTASAGETTYFKFNSTGGRFILTGTGDAYEDYFTTHLRFACPEKGGTVVVPDTMRASRLQLTVNGGEKAIDLALNNPTTEPVILVFTDTYFICAQHEPSRFNSELLVTANDRIDAPCTIGGGGQFVIGSGSIFEPDWNINWRYGGFTMQDEGQLIIEAGGVYNQFHTSQGTRLNPSTDGFASVVVCGGGVYQMGKCYGNGNGVYRLEDGATVRFVYPFGWENYNRTPFEGAQAVQIPEDATVTLCGYVNQWREHDKVVTNSVPFVGYGNVVISNAAPDHVFTFVQAATDSTLTGSIEVAEGAENASVVFLDGANWNGVVHSRNVSVDHAAGVPTTNAFGGLVLDDDWPIYVSADGTCDQLNLSQDGFSGTGKFVFTPLEGEGLPENLNGLVFGSVPLEWSVVPSVSAKGYRGSLKMFEDGLKMRLVQAGFTIIVR